MNDDIKQWLPVLGGLLVARGKITPDQLTELTAILDEPISPATIARLYVLYESVDGESKPANPKVTKRLADLEQRVGKLEAAQP